VRSWSTIHSSKNRPNWLGKLVSDILSFNMDTTRRDFLLKSALATLALGLGDVPFADHIPEGWVPEALADSPEAFGLKGKDGLTILGDKPLNAETPPHLLDDETTPTSRLFVRNNGLMPELAREKNSKGWTLTIDGEVDRPLVLSLEDLKKKFKQYSYQLVLECAGNGRSGFFPPTAGNQWTYGAVGCPVWSGPRLRDVLEMAGVKKSAVYTGYYGHDVHLSGDPEKVVISRGIPIQRAQLDYNLIAVEMNGRALSPVHGFPARLVCPGYPASVSGKWLKRITLRDREHDGEKMKGHSYRLPSHPAKPGEEVPENEMTILAELPVKSLITYPKSGESISARKRKNFECRGFAWTGDKKVTAVHVSYDFGQTWKEARLKDPRNPFAWQRWDVKLELPSVGYFEIWARATDTTGRMQPMVVPGWNPQGYYNNAMPRIAVRVTA